MNDRYFTSLTGMLSAVSDMETDERQRREDRATVSAFYNGAPPMSQEQADALGLGCNVNNLFGYDELAKAKGQLLSLYTKPPRLFEIEIDDAPKWAKQEWSMKATVELNKVIKRSQRLRVPYEGVAGDATMHGEGIFFFPNTTDWCPAHLPLSKRLIPSDAKQDKRELPYFSLAHELTFNVAFFHLKHQSHGWNLAGLRKILKQTMDRDEFTKDCDMKRTGSLDPMNPEEIEQHRQAGIIGDRAWRFVIPTHYFYQMRPDKPGCPYDLTVISRHAIDSRDDNPQAKLFERECYFPSIDQALHPLHMGCIIDGERLWHRTLGLGHLNYSLAWHVEILTNRLMQAVQEDATNFWEVADSASRETLEQILLQHNGIIPEGVKFAAGRMPRDFRGLLSTLQLFRQQTSKNAMQVTPNDGQKTDVLEVQAMYEQDQANSARSGHISTWFDYTECIGAEILSRFTSESIRPKDRGYSEILAFQAAMQRHKIPLRYLRRENVNVSVARIAGDGVRQKAVAEAQFLMSNIAMFPPGSQQKIKRRATAAITDDYELAEQLVPMEDKPDGSQVLAAMSEGNVCITQGIVPPLNDTDIVPVHLQQHFKGLQAILERAAARGEEAFKPEEAEGFKALGAHTAAHIQTLEEMGMKEEAKLAWDALNQLAAMGQKLANNMQQMEEEKGPQLDPIAAAKLQLDAQKLELARDKSEFGKEKFMRTQALREHSAATDEMLKLEKDNREERDTRFTHAIEDAKTAKELATPAPAPAADK